MGRSQPDREDREDALGRLWSRQVGPAEFWQIVERVAAVGDATVLELLRAWEVPDPEDVLDQLQLVPTTRLRHLRPRSRALVDGVVFCALRAPVDDGRG